MVPAQSLALKSFSANKRVAADIKKNMSATFNVPDETFEKIYSYHTWGHGEAGGKGSGTGSSMQGTAYIRPALISFVQTNQIQTMFDIPCGMMNWQMPMLNQIWLTNPQFTYQGMDIASNVINTLQQTVNDSRVTLTHRDVTQSPLVLDIPDPEHTMVMSRQMLQHLSDTAICKALHNFISIKAKFLLLDFFNKAQINAPRHDSGYPAREINLLLPPFNMPQPLQMLDDDPVYPRQMFVWNLHKLKQHKVC